MIRILVNSAAVSAALGAAESRVSHASPAWAVIAMKLRQSTLRNFLMGGWFPENWARSMAAEQRGGRTLVETSILKNSVHSNSGANWASAGPTDLVYAAIHQFGGRAGRNHAVELPARPYLPERNGRLHETDQSYIEGVLQRYIAEGDV